MRLGRELVSRVERGIGRRVDPLGQIGADMAACRKAQRRDPLWIEPVFPDAVADQAHCALGVDQRGIRTGGPALARQAVEQDKGGKAACGQPAGEFIAFFFDHHPAVTAARSNQHRRAVGPVGPEHRHPRAADPINGAVTDQRVGRAFINRFEQRLGRRTGRAAGLTIAVVVWTIGHMAHGLANTAVQFSLARAGLGIGEAGNFPAGVKAVTEWFPRRERAFATGLFKAGSNVGAILTPLLL